MSRYIDAEFEINHYTSMTTHPTPDVTEQDKRNSLIILNALRMAKSIDICFCGECKKRKKNKFCLEYMRYEKNDEGFCSYGERREP